MRILVERRIPSRDFLYGNPTQDVIYEATSELRELAVLKNAEGWESGKIDFNVITLPLDYSTKILVWMDMTEHDN